MQKGPTMLRVETQETDDPLICRPQGITPGAGGAHTPWIFANGYNSHCFATISTTHHCRTIGTEKVIFRETILTGREVEINELLRADVLVLSRHQWTLTAIPTLCSLFDLSPQQQLACDSSIHLSRFSRTVARTEAFQNLRSP